MKVVTHIRLRDRRSGIFATCTVREGSHFLDEDLLALIIAPRGHFLTFLNYEISMTYLESFPPSSLFGSGLKKKRKRLILSILGFI